MALLPWIVTASAGFLLLVIRILWVYREIQQSRSNQSAQIISKSVTRKRPCKTLVVLGSGGHTSEMLHMVRQLDTSLYDPLLYVVADTDHTSIKRLKANMDTTGTDNNSQTASNNNNNSHVKDENIYIIPRSREVGQSYVTSLLTTIYALLHAIVMVLLIRPELLLCNGPGTCVPLVLSVWIWRILGVVSCRIVFCESYCRVQTLSLSGKILYPGVDLFLVHWDSLYQKYPKSYRISTFVASK
jgi:beta-1,4-N-acetylglucosaminyltransferase